MTRVSLHPTWKRSQRKLSNQFATLAVGTALCAGASTAFAQVPIKTFQGTSGGELFGYCARNAGDYDGDGMLDLVVGSPGYSACYGSAPAGRAQVVSGADSSAPLAVVGGCWAWPYNYGSNLGVSVAALGDVNDDQKADVAFAGNHWVTSNGGAAGLVIAYGAGVQLWTSGGDSAYDYFGTVLTTIDDVNGDGKRDLIVSTPWEDIGGMADAGSVYVLSGATGAQLWKMHGVKASDQFGFAIGEIADIDGDGAPEVVIGEPGWDSGTKIDVGRVLIVSGRTGSPVLFDVQGTQAGQKLGLCVSGAGRLDGDPYDEFLATDSTDTVRVYSSLGGSLVYTKTSPTSGTGFGESLAGLDDVDGDGSDDFAIGDPLDQSSKGSVFIYSGATGALLTQYVGTAAGDEFGRSVAAAGDWNADGLADVMIGAPHDYSNFGKVYVYPGVCLDPVTYCSSKPNSTGQAAHIGSTGSVSIAANDLTLTASGCPPNKFALFYYGTSQIQLTFGDGFKCVGGQQVRFQPLHTTATGTASQWVDYQNPPKPSGQILAGSTWYFQLWYRDPNGPLGSNFNLTDGLKIDFCP